MESLEFHHRIRRSCIFCLLLHLYFVVFFFLFAVLLRLFNVGDLRTDFSIDAVSFGLQCLANLKSEFSLSLDGQSFRRLQQNQDLDENSNIWVIFFFFKRPFILSKNRISFAPVKNKRWSDFRFHWTTLELNEFNSFFFFRL